MTRLLPGFVWDGTCGGIDAYLVAFARAAAREGVRVDFLTNERSDAFAEELSRMGHGLYEIATLHDLPSQQATIAALHGENGYDAAYFNVSTALMLPAAKAALRAGVERVVVHAHAAGLDEASLARRAVLRAGNALCRPALRRAASLRVACSRDAGRWVFGGRAVREGAVSVVPNPVDARACAFDGQARMRVRGELGLDGRFVVGSVTAMKAIKNPLFLVDAFRKLLASRGDAVLVVVGDGEMAGEVRAHAERLLPAETYRFMGKRDDVPALLQAFDSFVLPSCREGLSIAAIEAQAAGLPCVVSEGVPEEAVAVPSLVRRLPLSAGAGAWARELARIGGQGAFGRSRQGCAADVEAAGYSEDSPLRVVRMIESLVRGSGGEESLC